jgi:aspartate kinase
MAASLCSDPPRREMDMLLATGEQVSIALLSMALHAEGVPAVSMTGTQAGIITESAHGRARILEVRTERLRRLLEDGHVVVVAGFQGTSSGHAGTPEITTLGRGGSDTSAVALAAALGADGCEIYTDVPGVLTTDPRKVSDAQLMASVSCDEMLELASLGAAVLHPRAVEIARNYGVPLTVRSSWSEAPGTRLTSGPARPIGHSNPEDDIMGGSRSRIARRRNSVCRPTGSSGGARPCNTAWARSPSTPSQFVSVFSASGRSASPTRVHAYSQPLPKRPSDRSLLRSKRPVWQPVVAHVPLLQVLRAPGTVH